MQRFHECVAKILTPQKLRVELEASEYRDTPRLRRFNGRRDDVSAQVALRESFESTRHLDSR